MNTPVTSRNRFQRHRKKVIAAMLVAVFVGAELATRVLARQGLVAYRPFPTTREPQFWADVNETFGVWHLPDAEFRHGTACFDVTYRSNSYGARDAERSRRSEAPRRVVVLGDSFVEGFGADTEARMTNLVEAATGIEHLNFGTSGNFGPVQEWLLYDSLASGFDHTDVFVFLLPANDFADMKPARFPADRYRPYLRGSGDTFEVWYPIAFGDRRVQEPQSPLRIARRHLYNSCYLLNAVRNAFEPDLKPTLDPSGPCTYAGVSSKGAEPLLFVYERLVRRAGDRRVTIFVIPRLRDLESCDEPEQTGIVAILKDFAASRPSVAVVDLLPHFARHAEANGLDYDAYFLSCDGHWSPLGNRVAAEAVIESVYGRSWALP